MKASTVHPGSMPIPVSKTLASYPWLMLLSRSALFLFFQVSIALIFGIVGIQNAWDESVRYWTFLAILANVASLFLLMRAYSIEGKRFWDSLRFSRETWKTDLPCPPDQD
jgi:hypothetical protein